MQRFSIKCGHADKQPACIACYLLLHVLLVAKLGAQANQIMLAVHKKSCGLARQKKIRIFERNGSQLNAYMQASSPHELRVTSRTFACENLARRHRSNDWREVARVFVFV